MKTSLLTFWSLGMVMFFFPLWTAAQQVTGTVIGDDNSILNGAEVYWIGTNVGAITENLGEFELSKDGITDQRLIANFIGYEADTVDMAEYDQVDFVLVSSETLQEVVVEGERPGIINSNRNAIKTEQITEIELEKAACCDLAGCFETQITVQPQTTNVITNSKELRILGLSGIYNQTLLDGFPMFQGLTYTYGISSVPGTLVNNIFVAKGSNSVLQGYESISGQINVITKEPDQTDQLLLNAYINSFLETQYNINYAFQKEKWSNLTAVHTTQAARRVDRDKDNFLDLPRISRYSIWNKWKYGNSNANGWHSKISGRYLNERRVGGQKNFDPKTDEGSTSVYGQTVQISQPEFWTKTGYRFNEKHALNGFASTSFHQQESYFGTVNYDAKQFLGYANVQYEFDYGTNHGLKTGTSFRYINTNEDIAFTNNSLGRTYDGNYKKEEIIPGLFVENTLQLFNDKFIWIAGVRADHHNQFGFQISPRTLVKYELTPTTVVRANIGTGWRTSNLFSEYVHLLVSSRDVVFLEELEPEKAVNFGANITQKFEMEKMNGSISADYYRTSFQNQIFPDHDTDPQKAYIQNFKGESVSNGFQVELFSQFFEVVEVKMGYNYLDVYSYQSGYKESLPFNAKHKFVSTLSYKPKSKKFHADANLHWYGQQRLPHTHYNPEEFRRPQYSDPYTTLSGQFTYTIKKVDVYVGCENIFDFRQKQPIISWEDPFSPYFDTASVWGPTRGREVYLGIRYKLSK